MSQYQARFQSEHIVNQILHIISINFRFKMGEIIFLSFFISDTKIVIYFKFTDNFHQFQIKNGRPYFSLLSYFRYKILNLKCEENFSKLSLFSLANPQVRPFARKVPKKVCTTCLEVSKLEGAWFSSG